LGVTPELEANLDKNIDINVFEKIQALKIKPTDKQTLNNLLDMSLKERREIQILNFSMGKRDYYDEYTIQQYIEHLPSLKYFLVSNESDEFYCLINIRNFLRDRETRIDAIKKFIKSIENDELKETYKNLIFESISSNSTVIEAYSKIANTTEGNRHPYPDFRLPLLNNNKKIVGIISKHALEEQISITVLKSFSISHFGLKNINKTKNK